MDTNKEYFTLTPIEINRIIELTDNQMQMNKIMREERLRFCLSLEECLLFWMEHLEIKKKCYLKFEKRMNVFNITVFCPGIQSNPLVISSDEEDCDDAENIQNLLVRLGLTLTYRYKNNVNQLSFQTKGKSTSFPLGMFFAAVGSIITILLFRVMSPSITDAVSSYIISPVQTLFSNMLSAIISPLLFLSVLIGITNSDDISSLRKRGALLFSGFSVHSVVMATIAVIIGFFAFQVQWKTGATTVNTDGSQMDFLVNIVPSNIISPFIENNTLQLVFMATVSGIIVLMLKQQVPTILMLIEQIYKCFKALMAFVAKIIPVYVYCSIVMSFRQLSDIPRTGFGVLIVSSCLLMSLFVLFLFLNVTWRTGVSAKVLLKKIYPSFMLLFSTASSAASFWHTQKLCKEGLGISENLTNIGLSLGIMIYMPGNLIFFTLSSIYMATIYSIGITTRWLVLLVFLVTIMTMAMPPIPAAGLICITSIFMGLGIPESAVLQIYVLGSFLDAFLTAINIISLELTLILSAKKLNEIDSVRLKLE